MSERQKTLNEEKKTAPGNQISFKPRILLASKPVLPQPHAAFASSSPTTLKSPPAIKSTVDWTVTVTTNKGLVEYPDSAPSSPVEQAPRPFIGPQPPPKPKQLQQQTPSSPSPTVKPQKFPIKRAKMSDSDEATAASTTSTTKTTQPSQLPPPATSLLKDVLDGKVELKVTEDPTLDIAEPRPTPGVCGQCMEQPANSYCDECDGEYCTICFKNQHRRGKRAQHQPQPLKSAPTKNQSVDHDDEEGKEDDNTDTTDLSSQIARIPSWAEERPDVILERFSAEWFCDRARFIPKRLTLKERKYLRLVEATMSISCYTDRVDAVGLKKAKRVHLQLQEICAVLTSIIASLNREMGVLLIRDQDYSKYTSTFSRIFEFARRYKIMNPEKMRSDYGKMLYLLQDSNSEDIKSLLQVPCVKNIETVYSFLQERNALGVLSDPNLFRATEQIMPEDKPRHQIQQEIKAKERAIEVISRAHCSAEITKDEIQQCIYSIGDNHAFLIGNRDPIDKMITLLKTFFSPDNVKDTFSLEISSGIGGSRLTHNHSRQYYYVLQSLTLWREVADDMFRLWCLAEQDLLSETNSYKLTDTGQGMHRLQQSPRISAAMRTILYRTQQMVGNWVGSSVIHLGDHNVPNALVFIDKYTQISRILNPIVLTIKHIDKLMDNDHIATYIKTSFKSAKNLKQIILHDFFRQGFDGSGGDNFFDAGSCIDGRLTSAWNWCSQLPQKPFFNIFKLAGFIGFDGEFQT